MTLSLLLSIAVSFHLPTPFSRSGRRSQASILLWASALPHACSQSLPSASGTWPCSLPPGDVLWPRWKVTEVKSASNILVNILGIHYCKCLYINSWSFTKLTLCHDAYNHLQDYCFISQIRSLFASEPSSDLVGVFATCTSFIYLFQICF